MRQRNTSGSVLDVWAYPTPEHPDRRPFTVGPNEETDYPELLAGFTSLEPEPAEAEAVGGAPEPAGSATATKAPRKTTAKNDGGEPA